MATIQNISNSKTIHLNLTSVSSTATSFTANYQTASTIATALPDTSDDFETTMIFTGDSVNKLIQAIAITPGGSSLLEPDDTLGDIQINMVK